MRRVRRALIFGTALATAAAWGILLSPTQLGGKVSYVILLGDSMEPGLKAGDLVIARARTEYGVGDVVAYRNRDLHQTVVHRIVGRAGDRYILAGDNNSWKDSHRPRASEILGAPLVRLPAVGRVLTLVGSPIPAAVAMGGVVWFALARPSGNRKRGGRSVRPATTP